MPYQPWQNYGYQNPYMNNLAQFQQPQNYNPQQFQQPQQATLSGEYVDSVDVVKAKNVDLSGKVVFYPKADLTEVYTKQLQANGTSLINTYRLIQPEQPKVQSQPQMVNADVLNELLSQMKQDIVAEISGIKEMLPAQMPGTPAQAAQMSPAKPARGGASK